MNKKLFLGIILTAAIGLFAACGGSGNGAISELERNRSLWQERKIRDYNYVIWKLDGKDVDWLPSQMHVRGGRLASKQPLGALGPKTKIDDYRDYETFEEIFEAVRKAVDKGQAVTIDYHKEFGYPEKVLINTKSSGDPAFSLEISKFEAVKPAE